MKKGKVNNPEAFFLAAANFSLTTFTFYLDYGESRKGRMADALAHGGDEGRDKLR